MYKTITALTIFVMLATSSMAGTFMPDSVAENKDVVSTDSITTLFNTNVEFPDSIDFEVPGYMLEEIDSMLNCWQARNLLKSQRYFLEHAGVSKPKYNM